MNGCPAHSTLMASDTTLRPFFYRRDIRRLISEVRIQTLESTIVISNSSTSKFTPKMSDIGFPYLLNEHCQFLFAATLCSSGTVDRILRVCGRYASLSPKGSEQ
jgi:hypothetical protein